MKRLSLIILIAISLLSCNDTSEVTIDGCRYIKTTSFTGNGPVSSLTHKGDCANPIHKKDTIYIEKSKTHE